MEKNAGIKLPYRFVRLLIVKLSSIGDIVHTLPALALIRRRLPEAEIAWVVERGVAEILRGNPFIDHLVEIDTRNGGAGAAVNSIQELRQFKFDVAIDFQGLLKSAVAARLSGAKRRWGFSREMLREPAARFFLTDTAATPARQHVIWKNLTLAAAAIGVDISADETLEFPIRTSEEHRARAAAIVAEAGSPIAVLNPGGGWVTKLWPAENFGTLADLLWDTYGLGSVLTTGPGEEVLAAKAAGASRSGKLITASPDLKSFYELAKLSGVYVGGDTGPTHIAVAAGAAVVGLFGPTEWWRNGSINADDICVERNDIACRVDCHRRTCGEWICMDISVEQVLAAVGERLGREAARSA